RNIIEMSLDIERQDSIPEFSELSLLENVVAILPQNYNYMVTEFQQFPNHITSEGFSIDHFEIKIFVNVDNVEGTHQWFSEYKEISKAMMCETKGFQIQGKK
ncbi:30038_t:CDS:1, partial [Racocetra persica]